MKIVRIGNTNYRAKHFEVRNGKDYYLFQFQPILFGFIPLWWDSFYGTVTLDYVQENLQRQLMTGNGELADLDIKLNR